MWINLEPVIQSKVRRRKMNIAYYTYIYGISLLLISCFASANSLTLKIHCLLFYKGANIFLGHYSSLGWRWGRWEAKGTTMNVGHRHTVFGTSIAVAATTSTSGANIYWSPTMHQVFLKFIHSFIWLCYVLVVGSSSLTRDRTWAPCTGSVEP